MLVLEERAANGIAVAPHIAQMQEMKRSPSRSIMPGRALSGRAPSEPEQRVTPLAGQVHRRHALGIVGLGRHDAWQAQQTEGWVVRVAAKPHADLLGDRRDLLEEVMEMLA